MNLLQARRRVPVRAAQWPLRLGGGNMYRRLLCTLGSSGAGGSGGGGRSGLFGLSQLHKPSALVALATRAINRYRPQTPTRPRVVQYCCLTTLNNFGFALFYIFTPIFLVEIYFRFVAAAHLISFYAILYQVNGF